MKIILLGYMGCGKSFLGKKLSIFLDCPFYDLDELIVNYEKISINDLFLNKNEEYFRRLERKIMINILNLKSSYVLSLGGGAPCYNNNIDIINSKGVSVYLRSSTQTLFNRLIKEKDKRPLISNIKNIDLYNFIETNLKTREYYYTKASIFIDIDKIEKISDIIDKIYKKLLKLNGVK